MYLIPRSLAKLDHYLLLHYPFIWRTKAHYVVWYFLLGSLLLFGAGSAIPVDINNLPQVSALEALTMWATLLSWPAVLYSCYQQYRLPVGEVGWLKRAGICAVYAGCFTLMLFVPHAFNFAYVARVAAVVTDKELERDLRFYKSVEPSSCRIRHPISEPPKHLLPMMRLLTRYGVLAEDSAARVHEQPCEQGGSRLVVDSFEGPIKFLGNRLTSVQTIKDYRSAYLDQYRLSFVALTALLLAAGLLAAIHARGAWRRAGGNLGGRVSIMRISLWQPRWFKRLDRHLRTRAPLFWSLGTHGFLLYAVPVAVGLSVWLVGTKPQVRAVVDGLKALGVVLAYPWGLPVIFASAWLMKQYRTNLSAQTLGRCYFALWTFQLVLAALPLLLFCFLWWSQPMTGNLKSNFLVLTHLSLLGATQIALLVLIGKYLKAWLVVGSFGLLIGVGAGMAYFFVLLNLRNETAFAITAGVFVFVCVLLSDVWWQSRFARLLAGSYALGLPLLGLLFWLTYVDSAATLTFCIVVALATPLLATSAIRYLIRARYLPENG